MKRKPGVDREVIKELGVCSVMGVAIDEGHDSEAFVGKMATRRKISFKGFELELEAQLYWVRS
jgi:hypothetical protein